MPDPQPEALTPAHVLTQFAPVPRAKDRHNGWKPAVQLAFIEALAETGSVKSAARRVGRAEVGAYLLRRHPEAGEFRKAWDIALDIGMRRIEDVAMDRALHGVEVPMYSYGKLIGTRTVYNDRLLMFMLRNRAPERFTGGKPNGLNAVDKMQLTRLKKQWRKDWEREAAQAHASAAQATGDSFIERIELMHHRWFITLGPQARAAYRQFRQTECDEARALSETRWAKHDAQNAREDLAAAQDPDEAADARAALAEAEQGLTAAADSAATAEADYAEWFTDERRAKVWWAIDVVFGAVSAPDDDQGTPGEPAGEKRE